MVFRYARHSQNLEKPKLFYTAILEFEFPGDFIDYDGYKGIYLGINGEKWRL